MNILFIHEVDWINKVVFDIHFLAESLSVLGHKVFAIDYENTWKRDSVFDLGSLKTHEVANVSRSLSNSSVTLIRPGFIKVPVLSRFTAVFTHYFTIKKVIKGKNIDVIMLYSIPTNSLQAIHLARKFNIPVVFRSMDILHILVPNPILSRITCSMEKRCYRSVDFILANTPQYQKYVLKMGAKENKVIGLPFPVDTNLFRPGRNFSDVKQKYGFAENDKIIVFTGTLFDFSGMDLFVQYFPEILEQIPEAKLLIVGDGTLRPKIEKIIANCTIMKGKVIITGFQPYQTMPQYINMATLCINPFIVNETTDDIFPSKVVQYAACGKAAVATPLRGITTLLPGEEQGVVYANHSDMAKTICSLIKSPEHLEKLGQSGLKYVTASYSYEKIAYKLEQILKEAIKNKHHA